MPTSDTTSALLAHELREALGRLVRRLRAEPGPPSGWTAVLGRLDRGGPASISWLAAAEHMRPQSMAQTIRDLEEAELVTRRPDPDDRRKVVVELTDAGLTVLHATRARSESWLTEALEGELDDDERALLHDALALLNRIVGAEKPRG